MARLIATFGHPVGARGGGKAVELDHSREYGELSCGPQFTHRRTKESDGGRIVSLKELKRKALDEYFNARDEP